jgi:DNA repair exonuclease SbcCD ATPase subunit
MSNQKIENWCITEMEWRNLFRYEALSGNINHKLTLDTNSTYLICGINNDVEGATSNGSGKSSILDIATWCIFGRVPRTSKASNVITRSKDIGFASVTFVKSDLQVTIERIRNLTGQTNRIKIFLGTVELPGTKPETYRTPTLTQTAILELFGFPPEMKKAWADYLSKVYFSTASTRGFLSSDIEPRDRQDIIERFLHLEQLDTAKVRAKKDIEATQNNIAILDQQLENYKTSIDLRSKQAIEHDIKSCKTDIETDTLKLTTIENEITLWKALNNKSHKIEVILSSTNSKLHLIEQQMKEVKYRYQRSIESEKGNQDLLQQWTPEVETQLQKHRHTLDALTEKHNSQISIVAGKKIDFTVANGQTKKANSEILDLEHQLRNLKICPKCKAPLMITNGQIQDFNKEELEAERNKAKNAYETAYSLSSSLEKEYNKEQEVELDIQTDMVKIRKQIQPLNELEQQVLHLPKLQTTSIIEEATRLTEQHEEALASSKEPQLLLTEFYNKHNIKHHRDIEERLDHLDKEKTSTQNSIHSFTVAVASWEQALENLASTQKNIDKTKSQLIKLREELVIANYWVKAFPEIKIAVIQRFIPTFESSVNRYLTEFAVNERICFEIENGFIIKVYDGSMWSNFTEFSAGEKARLLVAFGFALRDISSYNSTSELGFLFVDELLDSMDPAGFDFFFQVSNKIAGQKFIITHAKPDEVSNMCDTLLLVNRSDDKSTVSIQTAA